MPKYLYFDIYIYVYIGLENIPPARELLAAPET